MKINVLFSVLFSMVLLGCSKNEEALSLEENPTNYSWMNSNIPILSKSQNSESRVASIESGNANLFVSAEDMTATGIAFLNSTTGIISYHGRNSQPTGRLDIFTCDANGAFVFGASLVMGGRVNNVITDGNNRVFAALDTKDGPMLAVVEVVDGAFANTGSAPTIRLNGKSANGLVFSQEPTGEYVYTSTGGNGQSNLTLETADVVLSFDGKTPISQKTFVEKAGFQKVKVNGTQMSPVVFQGNENNRGKWVAKDGTGVVTMHYSTYVSNSYSHATIQYYPNYVQQFYQRVIDKKAVVERMNIIEGKSVCLLGPGQNGNKILYICAGDKGFNTFNIIQKGTEYSIEPIDVFSKMTSAAAFGADNLIYLACDQLGVKVLRNDNGTLAPVKYYKYRPSEESSFPSANFVAVNGDYIYVAYGSLGVVALHKDSETFKVGSGD